MSLITKLSLSGYCRGKKHTSHYSCPKGMATQVYIDKLAAHRKAFDAPYEIQVTMFEPA